VASLVPARHFTGTVRIEPLFRPSETAARWAPGVTFETLDGKSVDKVSDEQYRGLV
jgi:hypothetical protein